MYQPFLQTARRIQTPGPEIPRFIDRRLLPYPKLLYPRQVFTEPDNPFSTTELYINKLPFNRHNDIQYQFPDRLFDRDTLILMTFEVNFCISSGHTQQVMMFPMPERLCVHASERLYGDTWFTIWHKTTGNATKEYLERNFRELNGKVFYDNASGQFLKANPEPMPEVL